MATIGQTLKPGEAEYLTSSYPEYVQNYGTNYPVAGLAFDASSSETCYWNLRAWEYPGDGDLTVDVDWYADTASTGEVVFDVAVAALTPGDNQNIETKDFGPVSFSTGVHQLVTAQMPHRTTVLVTGQDALTGDDQMWLQLTRDIGDAGDTMAGDCIVTLVGVSYTT